MSPTKFRLLHRASGPSEAVDAGVNHKPEACFSRGEAFSREGKRFLERGSDLSRGEASSRKEKRFLERESVS